MGVGYVIGGVRKGWLGVNDFPPFSRMFHRRRCHTIYFKYGPEIFTEFLSITVPFIRDAYYTISTNTGNYCTGRKVIHVRFQVKLWPRKTVTRPSSSINSNFPLLGEGLPLKMTSNLILGLAHYFWGITFRKIHPPELHQNRHIQDAIFHPTFPPFVLDSLSYIQTLSTFTFLHQLRDQSTYSFIPERPYLIFIMVCYTSLNMNSNIHTSTLGAGNPPKKWISDFQDLRVGDLFSNSSNFPLQLLEPIAAPITISSSLFCWE